jgi:hypothetical protein
MRDEASLATVEIVRNEINIRSFLHSNQPLDECDKPSRFGDGVTGGHVMVLVTENIFPALQRHTEITQSR